MKSLTHTPEFTLSKKPKLNYIEQNFGLPCSGSNKWNLNIYCLNSLVKTQKKKHSLAIQMHNPKNMSKSCCISFRSTAWSSRKMLYNCRLTPCLKQISVTVFLWEPGLVHNCWHLYLGAQNGLVVTSGLMVPELILWSGRWYGICISWCQDQGLVNGFTGCISDGKKVWRLNLKYGLK